MKQPIHQKNGFTIIEVMIVLAITGLLMAGILAGATNNITRQRYNDSVQNFAEFLRNSYSEVVNIQNPRGKNTNLRCSVGSTKNIATDRGKYAGEPGRTECALYGKLIVFGDHSKDDSTVYSYDIIGRVFEPSDLEFNPQGSDSPDMTTLKALSAVDADIASFDYRKGSWGKKICSLKPAGNDVSYQPQWGAKIETTHWQHVPYKGLVMIVRSPISGSIHTYSLNLSEDPEWHSQTPELKIHEVLSGKNSEYQNLSCKDNQAFPKYNQLLDKKLLLSSFLPEKTAATDGSGLFSYKERPGGFREHQGKYHHTDFCIASPDTSIYGGRRRNVRLMGDGHNANAVKIIEYDKSVDSGVMDEGNACVSSRDEWLDRHREV